jgi:hypothetical protein
MVSGERVSSTHPDMISDKLGTQLDLMKIWKTRHEQLCEISISRHRQNAYAFQQLLIHKRELGFWGMKADIVIFRTIPCWYCQGIIYRFLTYVINTSIDNLVND